ncbi:MAG: YajQ family cyclic di-GMP-binding protein [Coriobacteriales bacterium]|nr:YajQ family cyclic di-GMP-binding protein [Coriobacteriales bacterium]
MAKDNSFDVVSQVDMQEVDNSVNQAEREITQRYDLKDTGSKLTLDKSASEIVITAPSDFVAGQIIDMLGSKLVRRHIDLKAVQWSEPEMVGGGNTKITGRIVSGIEADIARKINKDVRDDFKKVKVQIEGDKVRVFSGSRDELQGVISFLKEQDYGIPLQFVNYR